jgi:osmotically-inducible protein OsmY
MITLHTKQNLLFYSDADIEAAIWKAIGRDEGIRFLDMGSFSVSVNNGFVLLTGHLSRNDHRDIIENLACSTPGVLAVHNKLIVDSDLTIQVAERLSKDERTRRFIFPVGCAHGWVRIGGVVPGRELQLAVEEIASQVSSVRGILSRPRVVGEYPETERRPVQPRLQAKVYDHNRQEGIVIQVVIEPHNRLVTHVVVSVSDFHDGKFVIHEHLVPVEAMEVVNKEVIFLKRNGPPLNTFPAFGPLNFPLAPTNWQPPYPYECGRVRWPCEQG